MEARTIETRRLKLPQLWRYNEVTHASEILAFIEHATLIWKYCTFKMQRTSEVGPCMTLAWQLIFTLIFTSNITYTHTHTSTLHQNTHQPSTRQHTHQHAHTLAHFTSTHKSSTRQHKHQHTHTLAHFTSTHKSSTPQLTVALLSPKSAINLHLFNPIHLHQNAASPSSYHSQDSAHSIPAQCSLRPDTQPAYAPVAAAPRVPLITNMI
jgi:hypothetical protein